MDGKCTIGRCTMSDWTWVGVGLRLGITLVSGTGGSRRSGALGRLCCAAVNE